MSKLKFSKEFEEQVIQLQVDHLRQTSLEVCQLAVDCLARALFNDGLEYKQWSTRQEVTHYRLFGASKMRKNVILCMLKEQLGLGSKYYLLIILMDSFGMTHI